MFCMIINKALSSPTKSVPKMGVFRCKYVAPVRSSNSFLGFLEFSRVCPQKNPPGPTFPSEANTNS